MFFKASKVALWIGEFARSIGLYTTCKVGMVLETARVLFQLMVRGFSWAASFLKGRSAKATMIRKKVGFDLQYISG
ncbi:hypothetical protein D3C87_1389100 [compost metagenome]